jgi:hypothetical protein
MFKIEVDVKGTTHGHYWLNKHEDDFLQFLPNHFTRQYGEEITKDQLTVYKVEESKKDLLEGKIEQHKKNKIDCDSEAGKIKVCRHDEAQVAEGDFVRSSEFEQKKTEREEIFMLTSSPQTVADIPTVEHDFGDGAEPAVEIPIGHELAYSYETLELELVGVELSQWSYDKNGKFLGNE